MLGIDLFKSQEILSYYTACAQNEERLSAKSSNSVLLVIFRRKEPLFLLKNTFTKVYLNQHHYYQVFFRHLIHLPEST